MKVKVTESKIGVEYIADVISSCDQNGIECIVDDKNGDIYYYDPKRHKYGDDRLLQNNDTSIWDVIKDKQLFDAIMFDASGAIFKDFAVRWNDLQKKGDEDEVFKTDHCNPIRGNFAEKARNTRPPTAKDREEFEKFRKRWKSLGKKKDDSEEEEDYVDEFGLRVNGIEAQVSEGYEDDPRDWSASEGEVEIIWDTDEYEDFGIFSGDTSHYVIDYDRVDTHDDLINEVCGLIGKEYPDLDFDPSDFVIANEDEFWEQRGGNPGKLDDEMYTEDDDSDNEVAEALAKGLRVSVDDVSEKSGEYEYYSPDYIFGVKLPDGSEATYLVYNDEESAKTSAADDLGEKFQDAPEILAAAIDHFGFPTFAEYINGMDENELDELESLKDDLHKEEFANYVVNNLGVDYRGFAELNINELGPAWHLAEYDGKELELPNGMLAYRVD